jgi:hypothetical protein
VFPAHFGALAVNNLSEERLTNSSVRMLEFHFILFFFFLFFSTRLDARLIISQIIHETLYIRKTYQEADQQQKRSFCKVQIPFFSPFLVSSVKLLIKDILFLAIHPVNFGKVQKRMRNRRIL